MGNERIVSNQLAGFALGTESDLAGGLPPRLPMPARVPCWIDEALLGFQTLIIPAADEASARDVVAREAKGFRDSIELIREYPQLTGVRRALIGRITCPTSTHRSRLRIITVFNS